MLNYYLCETAKMIGLDYATHYYTRILTTKYTLKVHFLSLWISRQRLINEKYTKKLRLKKNKIKLKTNQH